MTPTEALAWLDASQMFGIKLGLENTSALLDRLDRPDRRCGFVFHVAGTNGKGSVCAMLESIARQAGLRCGLTTSPHLCDVRERVRVDGAWISPDDFALGLSRIRAASEGRLEIGPLGTLPQAPTYFEVITVMAVDHFARCGTEVAVLETGMGGRLDATNACSPGVSVITPIGWDHAQWLGDSLEKIAAEKAGIIKPGIPVVSAPQLPQVSEVLRATAAERSAPLHFVNAPYAGHIALAGSHQAWNAALALAAIEVSGLAIATEAQSHGLATIDWPARFQRLESRLVVDGSHNPPAMDTLVQTWREEFGSAMATVIFGAMSDKDIPAMLARLDTIAARYLFVPIGTPRAASPESFVSLTTRPSQCCASLAEALGQREGPTLVAGSLYLAGEMLALWQNHPDQITTA